VCLSEFICMDVFIWDYLLPTLDDDYKTIFSTHLLPTVVEFHIQQKLLCQPNHLPHFVSKQDLAVPSQQPQPDN